MHIEKYNMYIYYDGHSHVSQKDLLLKFSLVLPFILFVNCDYTLFPVGKQVMKNGRDPFVFPFPI